jgi:integrase/recombinase XerC
MLERFRTYITVEKRFSPLTVRNYMADLREFLAMCGIAEEEFDPNEIDRDMVRGWVVALGKRKNSRGQSLAAASINRRISTIKSFFAWLMREGLIEKNPTMALPRLKTPLRLPNYVSEEQMSVSVEHLTEELSEENSFTATRNALIILMFYGLGIRRAELVGLNRDDLSEDMTQLRIHGKGGKVRIVPVLRFIADHIQEYLNEISRSEICIIDKNALILSLKGTRLSSHSVYCIVRREMQRMGLKGKKSPHVLRHTFATHLMNRGGDMRQIQELMGHSSLRSTQVYTHNSISSLQKIYDSAHPRGRRNENCDSDD